MSRFECWLEDELCFMCDNEMLLIGLIGDDEYIARYQEIMDVIENGYQSEYYELYLNMFLDEGKC